MQFSFGCYMGTSQGIRAMTLPYAAVSLLEVKQLETQRRASAKAWDVTVEPSSAATSVMPLQSPIVRLLVARRPIEAEALCWVPNGR